MKTSLIRLTVLVVALAGSLGSGGLNATAEMEVSAAVQINAASDFYEPLGAEGDWVEVSHYGRCWHPARVAAGWRPYCDGVWVWTDCGWYWQSDEPWAWACYHYGSWAYDPIYGWVWIPGVEWAPAWVYWRFGGGYIGWAPCSPRGVVESSAFVFVDEHHFQQRQRPSTVIVNNLTIISHTRQISGSRRESRDIDGRRQTVMVNAGPDVNAVEKATGRRFTTVSVQEADRHTAVPPSARRRRSESPGGARPTVVQEQTRPAPEPNPPPSKHNVVPAQPPPDRPIAPGEPEEKNNPGPGHEKDRDQDH